MEHYAARSETGAIQSMEGLHTCHAVGKKCPETKQGILTHSIYIKLIHDMRIDGRVINFGKQERGSG